MDASARARHASEVRWGKEQPFAAALAALREQRAKGPPLTKEQRAAAVAKKKQEREALRAKAKADREKAKGAKPAAGPKRNDAAFARAAAQRQKQTNAANTRTSRAEQAQQQHMAQQTARQASAQERLRGKAGPKRPDSGEAASAASRARMADRAAGARRENATQNQRAKDKTALSRHKDEQTRNKAEHATAQRNEAAQEHLRTRIGRQDERNAQHASHAAAAQERATTRQAAAQERTATRDKAKAERTTTATAHQDRLHDLALERHASGGKLSDSQRVSLEEAGLLDKDGALTPKGKARVKPATTKALPMDTYATLFDQLTDLADDFAATADADDAAIKAGRRNSASDADMIQAIYASAEDICELAVALGAELTPEDEEEPDEADALIGDDEGAVGGTVQMVGKALIESVYGGAIKALEGDGIGGFAVLFGDATTPDLSEHQDYFTKSADYWLDHFGWPRPMTYHHGQDADTRDEPIVGTWTKAVVKDEGIWLEGQLDRAHRYHGAIKELIRRGYLKLSSDSAPQWVVRERQPNGTNEIKRWPLISASPTVTPAEPRLSGLAFKALVAELGLSIDSNPEANETPDRERPDGAQAADADRLRRLLLQSHYLHLQE